MAEEKVSQSWTLFLGPIRETLERVPPLDGPFDPQAAWEHKYSVCTLTPERGAKGEHPRPIGKLVLNRKPGAQGTFSLDVNFAISTRGPSGMRTQASLTCAADRLASLRKWELRSEAVEGGKPVKDTAITETAAIERGMLVRHGRRERRVSLRNPLTSNWTLMEAVQRLPFHDLPPQHFDMLEELDLHKPEQTLRPVADVHVEMGGRKVRLYGFRQLGRGILPVHYWLDDRHRLIAVTGSLRGYIWERA